MSHLEDIQTFLSSASHSDGVTKAHYLAHARTLLVELKEHVGRLEAGLDAQEREMVRVSQVTAT